MIALTVASVALVAVVLFWYVRWAKRFGREYTSPPPPLPDDQLPKVCVVVPLRGADPFLPQSLAGLFQQDYPDYRVRIVLDHEDDPAGEAVREAMETFPSDHVHVSVLADRRESCGLKNSALVQAVSELDDDVEAVAVLDADAIPDEDWLRHLVAPLADPEVGAATGIRWFAPPVRNLGTLVRHQWNILAAMQMHHFQIPWGGSVVIRTSVIREAGHVERWAETLCDDTSLTTSLWAVNKKLAFVPQLTMLNRETTTYGEVWRYMRRQMVFARLHHPNWGGILFAGLAAALAPTLLVGTLIANLVMGQWLLAGVSAAALVMFQLGMTLVVKSVSRHPRRILAERGVEVPRSPVTLTTLLTSQVTSLVYAFSLISAIFVTRVSWRGVSYRLLPRRRVRMLDYHPWKDERPVSSLPNGSI